MVSRVKPYLDLPKELIELSCYYASEQSRCSQCNRVEDHDEYLGVYECDVCKVVLCEHTCGMGNDVHYNDPHLDERTCPHVCITCLEKFKGEWFTFHNHTHPIHHRSELDEHWTVNDHVIKFLNLGNDIKID